MHMNNIDIVDQFISALGREIKIEMSVIDILIHDPV